MFRKAPKINLTIKQEQAIKKIISCKKIEHRYYQRALIILRASSGESNYKIAKNMKLQRATVSFWRKKWITSIDKLTALESENAFRKYLSSILKILSDSQRPGAPTKFTAEEVCQIISLACEAPELSGYSVTHWSVDLLTKEVMKRGIVKSISASQIGRFLKSSRLEAT